MDPSWIATWVVAVALLATLVFGSQYGGLISWLRHRRKRQAGEGFVATSDTALSEVTTDHQTAPIAFPPQTSPTKEPRNVAINRILNERHQLRAARWALVLPHLLTSIAAFPMLIGAGLVFLGLVFSPDLRTPSIGGVVGGIAFWSDCAIYFIGQVTPVFILHAANIILLIRDLRQPYR